MIVVFVVVRLRLNSENLRKLHIFPCKTLSRFLRERDFKMALSQKSAEN